MPGGRPRGFRLGDRSELLVEYLLGGVAFTTRVPRQEDVGIDFMCSLITGSHRASVLEAGSFFSVQAKSHSEDLVYEKPHELQWIRNQKSPLLICVADRAAGAMDVYSTWNLICAIENGWKGQVQASRIRLCPGERSGEWPWVRDNPDKSQDVFLGRPVVRIAHDQLFDEDATQGLRKCSRVGWQSTGKILSIAMQVCTLWLDLANTRLTTRPEARTPHHTIGVLVMGRSAK